MHTVAAFSAFSNFASASTSCFVMIIAESDKQVGDGVDSEEPGGLYRFQNHVNAAALASASVNIGPQQHEDMVRLSVNI